LGISTVNHQNQFEMMQKVKVAAAQLTPAYLNKEKTIDKACEAIGEAANQGARLIVFPEVFISGYPDWVWLVPNSKGAMLNQLYIRLYESATYEGDPALTRIAEAARENAIHVIIGAHERNSEGSNGSLYNSYFFFNENGEMEGKHRKLIPTGGERLVWGQGDGRSLRVYDTPIGKIGGLICWENFMPLARNRLYESGIQIWAAPTWDKSENWLLSMRHIAREGGVFLISVCMPLKKEDIPDELEFKSLYPEDREWISTGQSCIIGPNGKILAGPAEAEEKILYADLDFADILAAKRSFDVAGHYARPDLFE